MSNANFVQAKLSVGIAAGAGSITLAPAEHPYQLPPTDGGVLVLADSMGQPSDVEIISYASRAGQVLSGVRRAQEGTTARAWPIGSYCYQSLTAGALGSAMSKDAQTSTADTTPNRLMLVGAGGLLSTAEILAGSWNDLAGMTRFVRGNTSIVTDGPVTTNQWLVGLFTSIGVGAGVLTCCLLTFGAQRNFTRLKINGVWQAWVEEFNTNNQFALGATRETARTALGITDSPGRVQPESNLGAVATSGAQTVNIDVTANESTSMSLESANTTGALTINFTNIPETGGTSLGYCVWYVDIARAGRKTVNFTFPAGNTLRWAGGAVPVLSNASAWRTQIMFEKKLGMPTVYASVVREGLVN